LNLYVDPESTVTIRMERRKYRKPMTIIEDIKILKRSLKAGENKDDVLKDIKRFLQKSLHVGGTFKDSKIQLQTGKREEVAVLLENDLGIKNIQLP